MKNTRVPIRGFIAVLGLIFFLCPNALADCTGCCSFHGGVVCVGGVTRCADGTPLSATCLAKGCNVCSSPPGAPIVSTGLAGSITTTSALLSGQVNPNGASTTYFFQYGASTGYGSTTVSASAGSGTSSVAVSATISGLNPGTTYNYRIAATNIVGTSYGLNDTFTTIPVPETTSCQLIFPQFADGGGYKTSLFITNGTATNTIAIVSFFSSSGSPASVTIGSTTATSFVVPIQASGAVKLTTAGTGTNISAGWVLVSPSPAVGLNGNAVFQAFKGGSLFSEAAVPAAAPSNHLEFFADEEGGFNTGFAIANPGMETATGSLTIRNLAGAVSGTYPISLPAGQHLATYLFQLFSGVPSGRAEISLTSGVLSATALRYHTSSIFSTVSVGTPGAGSSPISALFSPDGGVRARLVAEINKATSSIDIAIYSFTTDEIRDALISARNRGVAIRIIADSLQAAGPYSQISTLESQGFSLKRMSGSSGGYMHNKYMIIDKRVLFTGSYNWSANAEDNSFENAVFVIGTPVIRAFIADFQRLWTR